LKYLITFSGVARSGKDTAVQYMLSACNDSKRYAYADKLKEITIKSNKLLIQEFNNFLTRHNIEDCYISDENFYENKTPITRALIIGTAKTISKVKQNYFTEYTHEQIKKDDHDFAVISDLRLLSEYNKIALDFQDRKIVKVFIKNSRISANSLFYKDNSEQEIFQMDFDHVIDNNGTLDDLDLKIQELVKKITG
jgi:dephospho-CoA kinase